MAYLNDSATVHNNDSVSSSYRRKPERSAIIIIILSPWTNDQKEKDFKKLPVCYDNDSSLCFLVVSKFMQNLLKVLSSSLC